MPDRRNARAVLDLEWRVNRIELTAEQARRYLTELPRRAFELAVRRRIGRIRCPIHKRPPVLIVARGADGESQFALSTCCSALDRQLDLLLGRGRQRDEGFPDLN